MNGEALAFLRRWPRRNECLLAREGRKCLRGPADCFSAHREVVDVANIIEAAMSIHEKSVFGNAHDHGAMTPESVDVALLFLTYVSPT